MATTQEDQGEPLDHADHDMDGEHDFDEELIYDPDNLHAFQAFPGDQNWWIFRPDPGNTGRCEAINMRVTAETTMREIEENLIRMPDLQPGRRIGSALCSVDGTSALGTRAMGMLQHPV
jgi:hypothetical protein